jgi:hypothetical protein
MNPVLRMKIIPIIIMSCRRPIRTGIPRTVASSTVAAAILSGAAFPATATAALQDEARPEDFEPTE